MDLSGDMNLKKPSIVEVHVLIAANNWASVVKLLERRIQKRGGYFAGELIPLYFTYDHEDLEIRICLIFNNPEHIDYFVADVLRPIKGVLATRVRLTVMGKIFPTGYQSLLVDNSGLLSAHIFIQVVPGADKFVWRRLSKLGSDAGVYPTWIFRDYYEYDRDITLRLMGSNISALRKYLSAHVNAIQGIKHWRFKTMARLIPLINKGRLIDIAKTFI